MKKSFLFPLLLCLALLSFSGCNSSLPPRNVPNPSSDFEYEVNNEGGITITKYVGKSCDVIIPNTIQGKEVMEIGKLAFASNIATSVRMPDTVVSINAYAFYQCDKLETIELSKNLTEIMAGAFQECTQLKHITIPAKVTQIGDQAFEGAGLESIIFEEGIETIGGYGSFAQTQIKELVLPSTVKEIGRSTFAANQKLESIVLNEGLITIGHKAFVNNPSLKEIIIPKTVEFVTEMDFNMCSGLEKILFDGDAPATFEYSDEIAGVWEPYDVHFTVYYREGAKGFTSPTWYGYPAQIR